MPTRPKHSSPLRQTQRASGLQCPQQKGGSDPFQAARRRGVGSRRQSDCPPPPRALRAAATVRAAASAWQRLLPRPLVQSTGSTPAQVVGSRLITRGAGQRAGCGIGTSSSATRADAITEPLASRSSRAAIFRELAYRACTGLFAFAVVRAPTIIDLGTGRIVRDERLRHLRQNRQRSGG